MKLISIVIATFNAADTLEQCLNSICSQKGENIELLILDGGSVDSTPFIIEKYSEWIDYYISEPDKGIYDAWNKGIDNSSGKWIMFIGADDSLLDNTLDIFKRFINSIKNKQCDYICAKANYLDREKSVIKVIGLPWEWSKFKRKMDIVHVASLHNRDLFFETGKFNMHYKICGDYELLLRKKGELKAMFLDKVVVNMMSGGASFSIKAINEARDIRKKYSELSWFQNWIIYMLQILLFYRFQILTYFNMNYR